MSTENGESIQKYSCASQQTWWRVNNVKST